MDIASALNHVNPPKRRKTDDFKPGFITRVMVRNFTTYSFAEFILSPSLNMIIGPNGTGKSTLISAICLGLGGKLDLIKRKTLKSMIKSGTTDAVIEVTIKNHGGAHNLTIRREFNETDSKWSVNRRPFTEKNIRILVKSFNIQLDNLCHFLPQERVAEFAGLSPEKLLLEIERTLGDGHLRETHLELIEQDNEAVQISEEITSFEERLEVLSKERDEMELEAQKFKEYQKVVESLAYHQKLIPYVQLSDMKRGQENLKIKRNELKIKVQEFEKSFEPIKKELEAIEAKLENDIHAKVETYEARESKYHANLKQLQGNADRITNHIDENKAAITNLLNRSRNKAAELDALRKEEVALQKKYNELPEIDEELVARLQKELEAHTEKVLGVDRRLDELSDTLRQPRNEVIDLKEKIHRLQEKLNSKDRLQLLEPNSYNHQARDSAHKGHTILRQHPDLKPYYHEAPVVCCTANQAYAHYLEKIVDDNTLFSITVTSSENYKAITDVVFQSVNIPIRKVDYRPDQAFPPKPMVPVEEAKRFGFDGYLIDFIEGPREVLAMLCDVSKIHMIPVSRKKLTQAQIDRLTDSSRPILFNKFIAGDTLFNLGKSKYASKQVFYSTDYIRAQSHYFAASGLTQEAKNHILGQINEMQQRQDAAKAECHKLQEEIYRVEGEKKLLRNRAKDSEMELEDIYRKKNAKVVLFDRIENKKRAIRTMERESKADYTARITSLKESIAQDHFKLVEVMNEISTVLEKKSGVEIAKTCMELTRLQYQNRRITLQGLQEGFHRRLETAKEEYREAKSAYDAIKNGPAAKELKKQSALYSQEEKVMLGNLVTKYREEGVFNEVFMRSKIQDLENEKALKATADQSSLTTLERKLAEISRLETELPQLIEKREELVKTLEETRKPWEEELISLVNKVSLQFNKYFTKVASDGRVEVCKADKLQDWKLHILVKFRQESELRVLDHQSQSGGERAVSTIFFIMSLQGMTDAPFRVVDEINQGMDPKNEKMAHRYLVHTACQNLSSQYFLVTPKLLTGLYYHPRMVVHCIYTGPGIDPVGPETKGFIDFVSTTNKQAQ